jgi:hypothetical protein
MKRDNWQRLGRLLDNHGFISADFVADDPATRWFVCTHPESDVTSNLRFVFKPKMNVLTVHFGWNHQISRDFCLAALQADWPQGYAWLKEVGVICAPCLSLFNLADHLEWSLGGMPISDVAAVYENAETKLAEWLESRQWFCQDAKELLACYIADKAPFNWRGSNSAIRLALIAGLSNSINRSSADFDQCASDHFLLIETDMFGLGTAAGWISSLRARLSLSLGIS